MVKSCLFLSNKSKPTRCPVCTALRIRDRTIQMGSSVTCTYCYISKCSTFLSLHWWWFPCYLFPPSITYKKCIQYISASNNLERDLRLILLEYVGICVILHETSWIPDFMKAHLHWRLDAYLCTCIGIIPRCLNTNASLALSCL